MPTKNWKIIDFGVNANRSGAPEKFRAGPQDLQTTGSWSVIGYPHGDGLKAGVDTISIDNGRLRLDVVPTRGMGIHRVGIKDDPELKSIGWRSPIRGPVNPAFVDLGEPSGL